MSSPTIETLPPEMQAAIDNILVPDTSIPVIKGQEPEKAVVPPVEKKEEPPVKKEELKPAVSADDDDPPETLPNEGRGDRWKEFRAKYGERKKEAKELREQLTEFEGTRKERDELKTRLVSLEEENKELGRIDSLSKLENNPDFQRKYVQARNAHIETVKRFAGIAEIEPEEILQALYKPEKVRYQAIDDMLAGVTPTLQTKIRNALDAIEGIDSARQLELTEASQSLTKYQQQQQEQQRQYVANEEKSRREVFQRVASDMAKKYALPDEKVKKLEKFFLSNESMEEAARILFMAETADDATASKSELEKKLADAEKELKQYRGATPGVGAGGSGEVAEEFKGDFVQAVLADIRKQGGF